MLVSAVLVLGSLCALLAVGCFPFLSGFLTIECVLLYVRFQMFFVLFLFFSLFLSGVLVSDLRIVMLVLDLIAMCSALCGFGLC